MVAIITIILMLAMLAVCIVTDLRVGKIYNRVTVPCAVLGLALAMVGGGMRGIGDHLLGIALVLVLMFLLSPLCPLGGGDTKLLAAVGALQGVHFIIWALLFTGVAGGVIALAVAIRRRMLRQMATTITANVLSLSVGASAPAVSGPSSGKILYSLAIAAGTLGALLIRA